jgi:hypothetical protein
MSLQIEICNTTINDGAVLAIAFIITGIRAGGVEADMVAFADYDK